MVASSYDIIRARVESERVMSVLKFGLPARERLRCENPICDELAQWRIALTVKEEGVNAPEEIFACTVHSAQLQIGRPVVRVEKLTEPGERNRPGTA